MNIPEEVDAEQYIEIYSSSDGSHKVIEEMVAFIKMIDHLEYEVTEKMNNISKLIQNAINSYPTKYVRNKYNPQICFILNKYNPQINIFMKYQGINFNRCQQIIASISIFKRIISTNITNKIPSKVNFWEYLSFLLSKTDQHLRKLEFKLKSIYYYIRNCTDFLKNPIFSEYEMNQKMKELIFHVDLTNGFIGNNEFDLMLESYIDSDYELCHFFNKTIQISSPSKIYMEENSSQAEQKYEEMPKGRAVSHLILNNFDFIIATLHEKSGSKKTDSKIHFSNYYKEIENSHENVSKFDSKLFDNLVNFLYFKITATKIVNRKMLIILRCAAFCYVCNRYYLLHSSDWLKKPSRTYTANICKIMYETPFDLKMSKEIIPSSFYDISFQTILMRPDFVQASNHMCKIQFLSCPLDIWNECFSAITASMCAAEKFDLNKLQSKMAFDDFFTILIPVFCSAKLAYPDALNSLLTFFAPAKKANSFNIAASSLLALLKIVETEI